MLGDANLGSVEAGMLGSQASGRNDDDLFGKGPGSNNNESMTNKMDERTSLLPDGKVASNKSKDGSKVDDSANGSKVVPDEGAGVNSEGAEPLED